MPETTDETIVRIDHKAKIAVVWTQNRGVINKLNRSGWSLTRSDTFQKRRGCWYKATAKQVSFRKPANSQARRGNSANLVKAREARKRGAE